MKNLLFTTMALLLWDAVQEQEGKIHTYTIKK
jgi:hypothetical protein